MVRTARDVDEALCRRGWFGQQPPEFRQRVLEAATWREYGDRELVLSEGAADHAVYAVIDGLLKYSHLTATGEEYLGKIFKPGDWFNLIGIVEDDTLPLSAYASGGACVLKLTQPAFEGLMTENPRYFAYFAQVLCLNLREAAQRLIDLQKFSTSQRLARFLLDMDATERIVRPEASGELQITQAELCQLLFVSRSTASKILIGWSKAGLVVRLYGGIRVLDHKALRAVAG